MMYFSRLKTWLVLGTCILGVLLALPNLFPAPAAWVPWRTIHLGLDLRGGSYLLLEVDMNAVIHERLDSLADSARTSLRRAGIVRFLVTPQPTQNRLTVRIDEPGKQDVANTALRDLTPDPEAFGREAAKMLLDEGAGALLALAPRESR